MKIYTKKGDAGETSLYGGQRVSKDDLRIRTYGTLDELNAVLGWVLAGRDSVQAEIRAQLLRLQGELFQLGAELATPPGQKMGTHLIDEAHVETLEREIDQMEAALAPLKTFILPGGGWVSAGLHLARTVSRRAERDLIRLHRHEPVRPGVLQYVNRLSDALFVTARYANHLEGIQDTPWLSR